MLSSDSVVSLAGSRWAVWFLFPPLGAEHLFRPVLGSTSRLPEASLGFPILARRQELRRVSPPSLGHSAALPVKCSSFSSPIISSF